MFYPKDLDDTSINSDRARRLMTMLCEVCDPRFMIRLNLGVLGFPRSTYVREFHDIRKLYPCIFRIIRYVLGESIIDDVWTALEVHLHDQFFKSTPERRLANVYATELAAFKDARNNKLVENFSPAMITWSNHELVVSYHYYHCHKQLTLPYNMDTVTKDFKGNLFPVMVNTTFTILAIFTILTLFTILVIITILTLFTGFTGR